MPYGVVARMNRTCSWGAQQNLGRRRMLYVVTRSIWFLRKCRKTGDVTKEN